MLHWINATAIDRRRALIAAWTAGNVPVAGLARRFRVSRKTAHKFINRFNLHGDAGEFAATERSSGLGSGCSSARRWLGSLLGSVRHDDRRWAIRFVHLEIGMRS